MTHQPLTKAEREELRRLDDQDRSVWSHDRGSVESTDPRALPGETSGFRFYMGSGARLAAAARNALPRLLADLDAAEAERDALRQIAEACCNATDGGCSPGVSVEFLRDVPKEVAHIRDQRDKAGAQRDRAESELDAERRMRVEAEAASDRLMAERDALKAKLDDPRRVLIHETEVVATKEEIAKLKKELADLSEADEELRACRALVNATSENLSVDLERMVDDLAEANEKAARSEKDAHSWCELYTNTKAKLAALVEAAEPFACDQGCDAVHHPVKDRHDQRENCPVVNRLRAAIAAARGGAS